jgi:hypothetical protein
METREITRTFSNFGTRNEVRMRVVEEFSKEEPGQGNGLLASRFIYYVEKLASGQRIFLSRPANLHNGFDFVVRVEGMNFAEQGKKCRDAPSHDDIVNDLKQKNMENAVEYAQFYSLIKAVYECRDLPDETIARIHFQSGFAPELSLKVIQWLFIEQDIRYWNYSGRDMLWSGIPVPLPAQRR